MDSVQKPPVEVNQGARFHRAISFSEKEGDSSAMLMI
jgi:hypothetical protein